MTPAQAALGALVFAPLLAAAVCVVVSRVVRHILGVLVAATVVLLVALVLVEVGAGRPVILQVSGYREPLGITMHADGLSALFLLLTAVVGVVVTCFAVILPRSTGYPAHSGFWPLWLACWAGLNAVFVAGDLFNTYVGLELVGLSAVGLVALGGRDSWLAALRYLFVAVLGSLLFLIAIAAIASVTGTLDLRRAATVVAADPTTHPVIIAALVLLTVGLALKLALVPMHRWLIPAHAGAPGAVSPLLSGLVIKASLFVILRCWLWLAGPGLFLDADAGPVPFALSGLGWVLAGLGVLALLVGSIMALRQDQLKRLVAYSTVSQVGYWFLIFPVLLHPLSDTLEDLGVQSPVPSAVVANAVAGAVGLALGHGLAKAGLFLAAGFLKDTYGTDTIGLLRGTARNHPILLMGIGLSAVGLIGLPISLGFTGKWQLFTAAVGGGHYWVVIVVLGATLLTASYLLRALAPLLSEPDADDPAAPAERVAPTSGRRSVLAQLAPLVLGIATIVTGFGGAWITDLIAVGAPW